VTSVALIALWGWRDDQRCYGDEWAREPMNVWGARLPSGADDVPRCAAVHCVTLEGYVGPRHALCVGFGPRMIDEAANLTTRRSIMADEVSKKMGESDDRIARWDDEDRYWRDNFRTRPYASADLGYEYYQPGYRYGYEMASQHRGRNWGDVESQLRTGWDTYPHRGSTKSTWDQMKDSVRDAWNRVTGKT